MKLTIRLILVSLVLCAPAAWAQQEVDVTKHDMHPLLQLHVFGATFAGEPIEADVFIYRGGPTFLAFTQGAGARQVDRGVASPQELMTLNQALTAARVGQQRGNCGGPIPDFITGYALTWYGAQGRLRTIPVGGDFTGCPAAVVQVFDATCDFIREVLGPATGICPASGP
jgi:hypothetical protein